jgi:hypothetical protein
MAVDSGTARPHHGAMSIRGKDAQETRFRGRIWWHANRDWIGVLMTISAIGGAFLLIARAFG